ncbi:MAG: flagellar basal-body rod protein FlgB [Clostridiales bacterium]|jgi:flagellar basal-body rod protein FlgB|nr:flagellar basal-body rod protein FlgB [Clostridiales bacterium]
MLKTTFENLNFLGRALDGSWLKNSAIANNIANSETPGYKRQTVNFEDVLQKEVNAAQSVSMVKTNAKHLDAPNASSNGFTVETESSTSYRVDENNVDVDVENAEMAKNTLYYNSLVNEVNSQYTRLKTAMKINE